MTPLELDRAKIESLLARAVDRLPGDWVLLGDSLAAVWFRADKVAGDIDLVSLDESPAARFALMDFAEAEGLPVEAVNSAADFFLRRIPGWRNELVPFREGAAGNVLRPTPTLFLLLKSERMSESDLGDCVALLSMAKTQKLLVDLARVKARLDELDELDAAPDAPPGAVERRAELRLAMAQVDSVVDHLVRWATLQEDIRGILLVGSHARGTANVHSDVDLVMLCRTPARYLNDIAWISDLGEVARVEREDWGKVHVVRVFYRLGREIEYGITSLDWAGEPADEGTLQVLRGGARVLLDRDGELHRLMERR